MKLIIVTVISLASFAWQTMAQNLVVNGGFESPVISPGVGILYLGPNDSTITGWTTDGAPYDGVQFAEGLDYFGLGFNGTQDVQLTQSYTTLGGGIHQTINTTLGQLYQVSIDVSPRSAGSVDCFFGFGATTQTIATTVNGFQTFSWDVTATGSSTLIDIIGNPNSGVDQTIIDNVSVVAVPEPSTWALAMIGFVGLLFLRGSRRSQFGRLH